MSKVKAGGNKSWHNRGSEKAGISRDAATMKILVITKSAASAGTPLAARKPQSLQPAIKKPD